MTTLQLKARPWNREIRAYGGSVTSSKRINLLYIKKVLEIWGFLETEIVRIGKDEKLVSIFKDINGHVSNWIENEAKELKGSQLQRLDPAKLEDNRSDAFLHTMDRMMFHLKRKKDLFDDHQDIDYFEWLLEVPYLLEDKLEAYDLLLEENVFDFGVSPIRSTGKYAIENTDANYEKKIDELAFSM